MMNIYPVVIVYNKSIDNSITLLNLLKCKIPSSNVLVVDNSTSDFGIESYCKEYGYNYLSMHGNKGLSKAYNSAIDFLSGKMKSQDLIMWLDDDTPVTPAYFELLSITATKCNDCDIFMPIIMGQDGVIYSPNEGGFLRSKFMKAPNEKLNLDKINGINSCLAIRFNVFDNYKYTEDLFMDLTDNQFFDDMRAQKRKFIIIREVIHQNFFQRGNNVTAANVSKRLKIKYHDFMIYARKKNIFFLCLGLLKCYAWGVVLAKKTKSLGLFFDCICWGNENFAKNIFGINRKKI